MVFTRQEVRSEEDRLFQTLLENIDSSIEELNYLDEILDDIERQKEVEKEAHVAAFNSVSELAFDYFKNEFIKAIIESEEYNHYLFTEHTLFALEAHRTNLIFINPEGPGKINVQVNTFKLGDTEDWLAAAEAVYPKSRGIPDIDVRSHIWMEKIYKVDREGGSVERDGRDVTEEFIGKWTATITARLALIGSDKAPWWELLNYGNSHTGGQGTPYPLVYPTYFIDRVVRAIEIAFYKYYDDILKSFNYEESVELTEFADKMIKEFDPAIIARLKRQSKTADIYKIIDQINADQTVWELYLTSQGKVGARYALARNIRRTR